VHRKHASVYDLPPLLPHAAGDLVLAEVEVQKLQQNAEREKVQAQITVTQANAKANAVRAEAQANADATRLNGEARASNIKITGEAEAAAIEARAKEVGTNPNLVTLVQAEKWNGVLPTTMVGSYPRPKWFRQLKPQLLLSPSTALSPPPHLDTLPSATLAARSARRPTPAIIPHPTPASPPPVC